MRRFVIWLMLWMFFSLNTSAQGVLKLTRTGNNYYADTTNSAGYEYAKQYYQIALQQDSSLIRARYNLGNAFYKAQLADSAITTYDRMLSNPKLSASERFQVLHNKGNSYLQKEDYEKGIEAYKEALKLNSNEKETADTKYNLAYAQRKFAEQQQQQQQKGQGDNKQEKGDDDKKEKDKSEQQQSKPGEQKEDEKKEQQQPKPQSGIKKEDAERMLNALDNQEKNTLDKVKKQNIPENRHQTDKDW